MLASSLWVFSLGKEGIFRVFCPGKQSCLCISWIREQPRTLFWFVDLFVLVLGIEPGALCCPYTYTQRLGNRNKLESFHFRGLFVCLFFCSCPSSFCLKAFYHWVIFPPPKISLFWHILILIWMFLPAHMSVHHVCAMLMKAGGRCQTPWNWVPGAMNCSQCLLISGPFPWPHWTVFLLAETNVPGVYFFLCCPEK